MTLAIDFDYTIHDNAHPVPGRKMGPPMPGAKEALELFKRHGHEIIIHSCNNPRVIRDWMLYWQVPFDSIWTEPGKPIADFYIDDRAFRFTSWSQTLEDIIANQAGQL